MNDIDKFLEQLKDDYGLDFPDMDYLNEDDRNYMIRQLQDLSNLCNVIESELEEI